MGIGKCRYAKECSHYRKSSETCNKCKYARKCDLYTKTSYTCTHQGGEYCGRFREFESKEVKEICVH